MEEKKLPNEKGKKELSLEKLEKVEKAYLDLMKAYSSCLSPLYLEKGYTVAGGLKKIYSFSWDNVPGNDSEILLRFLKDNLRIGWAENAEIHKSDDGTICIFKDKNSANIMIDKKKKKATLKISDGRTHDLKVKKKHGKLSINPKIKHGAWLDLQKRFYKKRWLDLQKDGEFIYDIKAFKMVSRIINFIVYRIVRWKIRKKVDLLREIFLLLIITQNRNKISSEIIKRFEVYSEDMDKLSAQFTKYGFYGIILVVMPLVPLLIGIAEYGFDDIITIILILLYFLFYILFFILFGFFVSKRVFSDIAVSEKEKKIFVLIQEYVELA